jgi:hypothetical protein
MVVILAIALAVALLIVRGERPKRHPYRHPSGGRCPYRVD